MGFSMFAVFHCNLAEQSGLIYDRQIRFRSRYGNLFEGNLPVHIVFQMQTKRLPFKSACYFGVGAVVGVRADDENDGYLIAHIENFLQFTTEVPFNYSGFRFEDDLYGYRMPDRSRDQQTVRPISPRDFEVLVRLGLAEELSDKVSDTGFAEEQSEFVLEEQPFHGRRFGTSIVKAGTRSDEPPADSENLSLGLHIQRRHTS